MSVNPFAPVPVAIIEATPDPRTQEALLLGSSFEGGWGPTYGVGDNGNSHGPYQINAPYHPDISIEGAQDPVAATRYMLGAYQGAVNDQGDLWTSNPELAAEQAAAEAERPQVPYLANYGQDTLDQHWSDVVGVMAGSPTGPPRVIGGNGSQAQSLTSGSYTNAGLSIPGAGLVGGLWNDITGAAGGITSLADGMTKIIENLPQLMIRGLEIFAGGVLLTGGLIGVASVISKGSTPSTGDAYSSTKGLLKTGVKLAAGDEIGAARSAARAKASRSSTPARRQPGAAPRGTAPGSLNMTYRSHPGPGSTQRRYANIFDEHQAAQAKGREAARKAGPFPDDKELMRRPAPKRKAA